MEFTAIERRAFHAWMKDKALSHAKAAKLLGVTAHAVSMWCKGGGARSTQAAKLRRFIDPYMHTQELSTYVSSLPIVREKLQHATQFQLHAAKFYSAYLDQIESFTAEMMPAEMKPVTVSLTPLPPPLDSFPLLPCRILVTLVPVPGLPVVDPPPLVTKTTTVPGPHDRPDFLVMPDKAMEPNFRKNEKLSIVPFADGALHKSPNMDLKTFIKQVYSLLSPGSVVAVSVHGAPVTCRRLVFLGSAGNGGRELILTADNNSDEFTSLAIAAHTHVIIFGKVARYKEIK